MLHRSSLTEVPHASVTNSPLFEIKFIRLSLWQQCSREFTLLGGPAFAGKIFHRFVSNFTSDATLDFYSRGYKLSPAGTAHFRAMLTKPHVLSKVERSASMEIIGDHFFDHRKVGNLLGRAEIGDVNGKNLLAIEWTDLYSDLKFTSLFIDVYDDGRTVHEIHLRSKVAAYDSVKPHFSNTIRSIQWAKTESFTWWNDQIS